MNGLTDRYHKTWSLRLNTQTLQGQDAIGINNCVSFFDLVIGGAWPFLARDVNCLLYCDNERDLLCNIYTTASYKLEEGGGKNRSVMPLEALGRTRTTMTLAISY